VGLQRATAWSWRFLVVAGAVALGVFLIIQLNFIVVPLLIAVLLAALAAPLAIGLRAIKFPGWLATLTTLVAFFAVITGLFWLVIGAFVTGWDPLRERTILAYDDFVQYLLESPLQVSEQQLTGWFQEFIVEAQIDSAWLVSGALSVSSSVGSWLVGAGIAIFALIFFVHDGKDLGIHRFLVPQAARLHIGFGACGLEHPPQLRQGADFCGLCRRTWYWAWRILLGSALGCAHCDRCFLRSFCADCGGHCGGSARSIDRVGL